jgi:hypothetical protein
MSKDVFSKWLGGPNFVYAPQWASGRSNSGEFKKKYGLAGTRKKGRFNPNVTACSHAGCQVAARSKLDKKAYQSSQETKNA